MTLREHPALYKIAHKDRHIVWRTRLWMLEISVIAEMSYYNK